MPHLRLEYSAVLEARVDLEELCNKLSDCLKETRIFPLGGIRVRAFMADNFSIADKHLRNSFCDMVFRIGQGRSKQDRIDVGEVLMEEAKKNDNAIILYTIVDTSLAKFLANKGDEKKIPCFSVLGNLIMNFSKLLNQKASHVPSGQHAF